MTKLKTNNPIDSTFMKLSEPLSKDSAQLPKTLYVIIKNTLYLYHSFIMLIREQIKLSQKRISLTD